MWFIYAYFFKMCMQTWLWDLIRFTNVIAISICTRILHVQVIVNIILFVSYRRPTTQLFESEPEFLLQRLEEKIWVKQLFDLCSRFFILFLSKEVLEFYKFLEVIDLSCSIYVLFLCTKESLSSCSSNRLNYTIYSLSSSFLHSCDAHTKVMVGDDWFKSYYQVQVTLPTFLIMNLFGCFFFLAFCFGFEMNWFVIFFIKKKANF